MSLDWASFERESIESMGQPGQPSALQEYGISLLANLMQGSLKPSEVDTSEIAQKTLESRQALKDAWYDFKNLIFSAAMSTASDDAHERLVGLVFALANHKTIAGAGASRAEVDDLFKDLWGFGWVARDLWNGEFFPG